jgi:Rieske Fe-S protein
MTEQSQAGQCASRRGVLLGAGIAGACGALAGCSTAPVPYDAGVDGKAPGAPSTMAGPTGNSMAAGNAAAGGAHAAPQAGMTGTLLGMASEIPVGGGKLYAGPKVVVTQPVKGHFRAFSAVCTHVGCTCDMVSGGTINCPCHGAKFKISDGSVVAGPATSPLPAAKIAVSGGKIMLM